MRGVRVLAAALGGALAVSVAACSETDRGAMADASQPSETQVSSEASDLSSPSSTVVANGPVDIAETKLFKNRPGNAPRRPDGSYDYTAPGFKLFDICAELEHIDLSEYGLVSDGKNAVEGIAISCAFRKPGDKYRADAVTFYSSPTDFKTIEEQGTLKERSVSSHHLPLVRYASILDREACLMATESPGGALGAIAYGGMNPTFEANCKHLEKFVVPILSDLLLGEQ